MDYSGAREYILSLLEKNLANDLYYHGVHHTLDVLQSAENLAESEGVTGHSLTLLKTAALYHDSGFIYQYKDHEKRGVRLIEEVLPGFNYNTDQISTIASMIMATRIPQSPANQLEQILCDADLDYLGRPDFWQIVDKLYREFRSYGQVRDEEDWNKLQVKFFMAHSYFTKTSNKIREPLKNTHLKELKLKLSA